jgi:hypothetical protein
MVTETITEYSVETQEQDVEVTYCDRCGTAVGDEEPSPPVVIDPDVNTFTWPDIDELRSELAQKRNARNKLETIRETRPDMHVPKYHDVHNADDELEAAVERIDARLEQIAKKKEVKAYTLYEDTCPACIEALADGSLTGDHLLDAPGLTITEKEASSIRDEIETIAEFGDELSENVINHLVTTSFVILGSGALAVALSVGTFFGGVPVAVWLGLASVAVFHLIAMVVLFAGEHGLQAFRGHVREFREKRL